MPEYPGFRPETPKEGLNSEPEHADKKLTRRIAIGAAASALIGAELLRRRKKNNEVPGSEINQPQKTEKDSFVPAREGPISPPKSIEANTEFSEYIRDTIFDEIDEGWNKLGDKTAGFWWNKKSIITKGKGKRRPRTKIVKTLDYNVLLAAKNMRQPTEGIELLKVDSRGNSQEKGFRIEQGARRGVGTSYEVEAPVGYAVLAIKRVLPLDKKYQEVTYTPYTEALDVPIVRRKGFEYLLGKIGKAAEDLEDRHVGSKAFPGRKISEVLPKKVSLILSIIEHVDPFIFKRRSQELVKQGIAPERADTEAMKSMLNQVLVTVGANREMSYAYSISSAKARGLFQFIPPTYKQVRKQYGKAGLHGDFIKGMDDHENAAKASLLLFDSDLSILDKDIRNKIVKNPKVLGMYLASSYNGGAPRTERMMKAYPKDWPNRVLPETQDYIRKFLALYNAFEQ